MTDVLPPSGNGEVHRDVGDGKIPEVDAVACPAQESSREEAAGKGGEQGQRGSFIASSFTGMAIASLGMSCLLPFTHYGSELSISAIIWACICCFTGGFVAGYLLRKDLRFHGWRLLWLAAASPALLVWIFTILALFTGVEMERDTLHAIFSACGASVAGAVAGYHFDLGWWRHKIARPGSVFWMQLALVFLLGVGASLFVSCCFFTPFSIIIVGGGDIGGLAVLVQIGMVGVSPFVGGLVSGCLLNWVLKDRRWRPVYLAFGSPAIPYILLIPIGAGGFSELRTEELVGMLAWAAFSIFGSFAGYYSVLRVSRRKGTVRATPREDPPNGEEIDG